MIRNLWKILTVLLLLLNIAAPAQENINVGRPRIGLALSGGGARGFAHAGVLNILDSLNVPVDYIAGTSIGAIVGSLYSVGYSPQQIDSIAINTDWQSVFSDAPPRKQLAFFEKNEKGRFQLPLDWTKGRLQAPSGMINGQKVVMLLSRLMLPVCEVNDFDQLPVPFRCVAADLLSGNEVVLKQGSLAKAVRASMSVPSIFVPVEWDNLLLVDGGVMNNCPVDVVRQMGAEIVIAVNVSTPMKTREELDNPIAVLWQAYDLAGYKRVTENLADADLIITPDLSSFSNADFKKQKVGAMRNRGEAAARRAIPGLQKLLGDYREPRLVQKPAEFTGDLVNSVQIRGYRKLSFKFIYQNLNIHSGELLNIEYLEKRINHLYSLGYFKQITYEIRKNRSGKNDLFIFVDEKPRRQVRFGFRYQDNHKAIGGINLNLNDFPFSGIKNSLTYLFSGRQLIEWELSFPRRLFSTGLFPYLYNYYQDTPQDIYSGSDRIARYENRSFGGAAGLALLVHNWGIIKGEINLEKLLISPSIALRETFEWPEWKYRVYYSRLYARVDLLDDLLYPKHGYWGEVDYKKTIALIDQQEHYFRFATKHSFYGTMISGTTTGIHLFFGSNNSNQFYRHYYLGGPDMFVGKNYDEFSGSNVAVYRIEQRIPVWNSIEILGVANWGQTWEKPEDISITSKFNTGFGLGLQANSILGPVRYIFSWSGNNISQYFTLGFSLRAIWDERL